jgi:hypothetical protein
LYKGIEGFRAVGVTGMTVMPLLGVPLALLVRASPEDYGWVRNGDIPVMFIVWTISAMLVLS